MSEKIELRGEIRSVMIEKNASTFCCAVVRVRPSYQLKPAAGALILSHVQSALSAPHSLSHAARPALANLPVEATFL